MRTITAKQRQEIEDLSAEGRLGRLPVQTAEKDIHITELLKALSSLEVHHALFKDQDVRKEPMRHDTGIKLVFSGGTCLSKAHGLINRMSEDVDIKVVLEPAELKKSFGDRVRLKALHDEISKVLKQLDFPLLQYDEGSNPHIRDAHRYYVVGAGYEPAYASIPSLRPELKLELIQRNPRLPLEERQFGYLYESVAGLKSSAPLSISCISVSETTAEKVISLLRRCAYKWDGHQKKGDLDDTLVRHIYDVARIAEKVPDYLVKARGIFQDLVISDRDEFKGQNPEFDADPVSVLKRTLVKVSKSDELKSMYETKLLPLVFDDDQLTYEKSFSLFEGVAQSFLDSCSHL
ncbi:nucleotidyl transferase AbiEii/AbiGii toxin family protein [Undibacterium sp. Di27W]|uniref:nucleotidyl transferase AbiEii/AbiGii toxin family protein n=1 Tax=Undibacterium sp. Di27W TaxID=3413036 RepID=UPI003BF2B1E6